MKFRITFKDYNELNLNKIVNDALFEDKDEGWLEAFSNLSSVQRKEAMDGVRDKVIEFLDQWMKYQEYITIEFNMDTKTAMVVPTMSL